MSSTENLIEDLSDKEASMQMLAYKVLKTIQDLDSVLCFIWRELHHKNRGIPFS
tara:strand:- start:1278 stop:1439 length:162 start_codon:yes stop_codon:yes gene_type:complete